MRSSFSPRVAFLVSLLPIAVLAAEPAVQPMPNKRAAANIPALIDKLVQVADSDIGYSATVTGRSFLPLDHEGQFETGMLFQKPSVPSETMREIVKQGAAAVPHLVAHLGDKRTTKITIKHDFGAGGMYYAAAADYNERTTKPPPARKEDEDEENDRDRLFGRSTDRPHTLTVGDLCFVALGQIVNRRFNAVRYQPTAIIIVASPTQSPALLAAVKKEWGALTPERHRASLIADFLKPDSEYRRFGACQRLAYYYPDALEALSVQFLAQPTYDFTDVHSFVRKALYQTKDARKRRELFDVYLAKKGRSARDGILRQLFVDLDWLEIHESSRPSRLPMEYGTQPRELLVELYGYKKGVRSGQRPRFIDALESGEKARLIEEGLIYDRSVKIDRAVRDLLASIEQDDYLALACMKRLVGRGYDADIEKYCRRRLPQLKGDDREALQQMLDKLGWNLVHVAVERLDWDSLRALIADGTNLQAKARNGMTPLHVAATGGDMISLQLLLAAKVNLDPKNARGETPVLFAARADHDQTAQFLVQKGCAVSDILTAAIVGQRESAAALLSQDPALVRAATSHKRTPLHLAARWGHATVAELLLDKGALVNAEDEDERTPLLVAVTWGHESVARVLLDHKADVKKGLPYGGPKPLHLAVQRGDAKLVKLLLAHKADVNARAGEALASPLHCAVVKGVPAIAELLLEAGAAVEATDEKGRTALHVAAELGQTDVTRVLLKHKADVAARVRGKEYRKDYQPLHFAAANGHVAVMELLLANKADLRARTKLSGYTPLHLAAQRGHIDAARVLLKRGMDVNARDAGQCTPLFEAAWDGQVNMIRFLLENKADIQAANDDDYGPLSGACAAGHLEAARVLLDHKADVNAREKRYGWAPLHLAVGREDPALVRLLLDRGAAVDAVDANGETPLHRVASGGSVRVARVLLDHKANIRFTLKGTGAEPLHEAAAYGSPKMVALLLDRGADINARQKSDGRTPLHRAIEGDKEERPPLAVIALLLKRKADCTIKDKDGLTPLALAVKKKRTEIIQLLRKQGVKD